MPCHNYTPYHHTEKGKDMVQISANIDPRKAKPYILVRLSALVVLVPPLFETGT